MKLKLMVGAGAVALIAGAIGWFAWRTNTGTGETEQPTAEVKPTTVNIVRLSESKLAVAGIRTEPVRRGSLQLTRTLPARFAYDDTRHVALRSPTDGVLEQVLVKTGDAVTQGQALAVLRSPAIGSARNQILFRQTELELVQRAFRWEADIHDGVDQIAQLIRAGDPLDEIKRKMTDKTLGDYGGRLLTAYSQSRLADKLSRSVESIGDSGAVSGRVVQQRQSEQQQSAAALEAAIEQSVFQTHQSMAQAEAKVSEAQRAFRIAQQTLGTLLGTTAEFADGLDVSPDDHDVSQLIIRSPLTGTVESKSVSATERVVAQDELFIIADTTRLWVQADIRGRDWDSIRVANGDTVMVTTPSVDEPAQAATVYVIGRQVDPASGAIPLIANIDNTAGHFRPGLFARMAVPTEKLNDVVVVSEAAVIDLDGQASVFVQVESGFSPVAVDVGSRSGDQVEIRGGVTQGQSVVVAGALTLKSELLLEGEE